MGVKFNKVTWYSRMLSYIFVFGIFPVIVFNIGIKYYKTVEVITYGYASASESHLNSSYSAKSFQGSGSHIVRRNIEGEWVNNEDSSYTMTIKSSNMFYEKYKNDVTSSGAWIVRDSLPDTKFASMPSGLYLQKNSLSNTGTETILYYKILNLTEDTLSLSYLEKGNTLTFKKTAPKN